MPTVFPIMRAPIGLAGWRKDSMPSGTWAWMTKTDGSFGPEAIISCPKCYADIQMSAEQVYGKKSISHAVRTIFDPRRGQGIKTFPCNTQFYFRKDKGCVEMAS